jgi:LPS-assembly protein
MRRSWPSWIVIVLLGSMMPAARAADPPCPSQNADSAPPACPSQTTCSAPPRATAASSTVPLTAPGSLKQQLAESGPIEITADKSQFGLADSKGTLSGNVVVRQGQREIRTNEAQVDRNTGAVQADGHIEYSDPLVHVTGEKGNYSQSQGADFSGAQFNLKQRAARGTAKDLALTPQGQARMKGVTFTTCPLHDNSWQLKADSIVLDNNTKEGTGRDAQIDFMGVPLIYLPWLSFPLSSDRKSGFLFPTIGNTSYSGLQLSVPYYFNIRPNFDFTFEPTAYLRSGMDLGGELRWLAANQHGTLDWNFLPDDREYRICTLVDPSDPTGPANCKQGGTRSRIRLNDVLDVTQDWRLTLAAQNVSDPFYFEDFSQGPEGASTAFLERTALFSYRDEHWRIEGEAQQYQTIDYILSSESPLYSPFTRPYARVPRFAASSDYSTGPDDLLHYGFDSEIVDFQRPGDTNEVQGWRGDLTPRAYLDLTGPGYFLRPSFAWRATQYELQDTGNYSSSPSRNMPVVSVDTGLVFERDSGSHAKHRLTLEPRILYLYVPYRNQDKLPVFDSAVPDLNPVELFRTNRYVGADRMSDANQVSAGITSRLFDTASGTQFLAVTVGQAYYFTPPRVTLTSVFCPQTINCLGENLGTENRSNFVVQVAVNAFQSWSADMAVQWDPQTQASQRTQVNLQYKPADDSVINLSYRYERYTFDQVELSGAWPIYRNWHVFIRDIYSLSDHSYRDFTTQETPVPGGPIQGPLIYAPQVGFLERFAGFEYRACCWRARFGVRRYVSSHDGSQDTGVWLQLELGGLASVGSASDASIGQEIRGYVPPEGLPTRSLGPLRGVW